MTSFNEHFRRPADGRHSGQEFLHSAEWTSVAVFSSTVRALELNTARPAGLSGGPEVHSVLHGFGDADDADPWNLRGPVPGH